MSAHITQQKLAQQKQRPDNSASSSSLQVSPSQRPFANKPANQPVDKHVSEPIAASQGPEIQAKAAPKGFNFSEINIISPQASPNSMSLPGVLQPKLSVGEPNDKYEQEADAVAQAVVQSIHSAPLDQSQEHNLQRMPLVIMRAPIQRDGGVMSGPVDSGFESQLNQARGGGSPLESGIRTQMESAMGADFSQVKIHNDSNADRLSQSIQAKAFTTGQDVFFKQGEYSPSSRGGQELLAHELTHVVQQNGVQRCAIQRDTEQPAATYTPQDGPTQTNDEQVMQLIATATAQQENLKVVINETIEQINKRKRGRVQGEQPCHNGDPGFAHIVKGVDSAIRKIESDYADVDSPAKKLIDVCRGTIVCTNAAQMRAAQEILGKKITGYKNKVGRIKNTWDEGTGYGDIKFNLPVGAPENPDGTPRDQMLLCEIQVMTTAMAEEKHDWGHHLYKVTRAATKVDAAPDISGRATATWSVEANDETTAAAAELVTDLKWAILKAGLGGDAASVKAKLQTLASGTGITLEGREKTGLEMANDMGYGRARE